MLMAFDLLTERLLLGADPLFLQALFIVRLQRLDLLAPGAWAERFADQFVKLFDRYFFVAQLRTGAGRDNVQDPGLVNAVGQALADELFLAIGQHG